MNSTLAVSLHDHDHDPNREPSNDHSTPNDRGWISPPAVNFETPGASSSALSCYSDFEEDPFFGVDLSNADGVPSFLEGEPGWEFPISSNTNSTAVEPPRHAAATAAAAADASYPLTPDQTASIHTSSPLTRPRPDNPPVSISPQELQKPFKPDPIITQPTQLTPSQSSSARSSEDGLAPAPVRMQTQSPRVTVSVWGQDDNAPTHTVERTFEYEDSPATMRGGIQSAGDLISSNQGDQDPASVPRDASGRWQRDPATGQAGLDPRHRPSDEVPSIKELADRRKSEERNEEVGRWLSGNLDEVSAPREKTEEELQSLERTRTDSQDNIELGDQTENVPIPGQTYYDPTGVAMNDQDREIIAADHKWADPPMIHPIITGTPGHNQPATSQAAIERFERMCRDNDSILSRQATWGTRRRSIHSTADVDVDGTLSGNFLKKLSISKNQDKGNKAGSILKDLRGFVRRPSINSLRKRRSSNASDISQQEDGPPLEKRDSAGSPHLAPPDRTSSWGKRSTPSINTALASMGSSVASVGTAHARKSSVGAVSTTSPRNFMQSLRVENTLQRQRSNSDVPKPTVTPDSAESHSNIVGMWKASGGPPIVAALSRPVSNPEPDDDDDEDDDLQEDSEMRADANLIDNVTPNFAGFQQHVLMLNPYMDGQYSYLVDRIAHQQIVRYKTLLGLKVKHLGLGARCPCGSLCIAMGGQANVLDQKADAKGLDPLATHLPDDDDDDVTPTDGAVNHDSFPQDIPMPPTQHLPAEFECQLCYSRKKFTKPSDWTKHVHEDVQPFTCTWDKCRDAKSFKRKADWVRHENEGHRHLEWWTCDVQDCRHTCYRRDNFLQHLVREHKYLEPKAKTKAAIKKAGGLDPTWKKVDQCHVLTSGRPQEEPCKFCGKTFPTWKKLTVHLAKHMEQISLPVLRLVTAKAKEIDADTIISPVQDPPPRQSFQLPVTQYPVPDPTAHDHAQMPSAQQYQDSGPYIYPVMPPDQQQYGQQNYYAAQYGSMSMGHTLQQSSMGMGPMDHGFSHNGQMQDMPVTSGPYGQGSNHYMATIPGNNADAGLEPFPALTTDGLGLQGVGGGPMGTSTGYNGIIDPSTASASPFSGHGSVSPYMRSPYLNVNGADKPWDDRQVSGYP